MRHLLDIAFTVLSLGAASTLIVIASLCAFGIFDSIAARFPETRRLMRWILSLPLAFLIALVAGMLVQIPIWVLPIRPEWLGEFVAMTAVGVVIRVYLLVGVFSLFPRPWIFVWLLLIEEAVWSLTAAHNLIFFDRLVNAGPDHDPVRYASVIVVTLLTVATCIYMALSRRRSEAGQVEYG